MRPATLPCPSSLARGRCSECTDSLARMGHQAGPDPGAVLKPPAIQKRCTTSRLVPLSLQAASCGKVAERDGVTVIRIPMSEPDITTAEREAVCGVLQTPTLALGPRLDLFERRLCDYAGVPHAVGVSS